MAPRSPLGVRDRLLLSPGNRSRLGRDITAAVVDVSRSGDCETYPQLEVTVVDPGGRLVESNLLLEQGVRDVGSPATYFLKALDLEFDGVFYRLAKVTPAGNMATLVFRHRFVVYAERTTGPLVASRSTTTRAEFIRREVDEVNARPGLRRDAGKRVGFWTFRPGRQMPTAVDRDALSERAEDRDVDSVRDAAKSARGLKLRGNDTDAAQRRNMAIVVGVIQQRKASPKAALALVEACIVEAPDFNNPNGGDASSVGILQLLSSHLNGSTSTDGGRRDVAKVADLFLTTGFTGRGGAISIAASNPGMSAGNVAQAVQGSAYPDRYDGVANDAKRVLAAFGSYDLGAGDLSTGEGGSYVKPYKFRRARGEDAWASTGKLAEEVGRRRFITIPAYGSDVLVYSSDADLLKLKPQVTIDMDAAYIVGDPAYDIDDGKDVRSLSLTVRGREFDQDFAWGIPAKVVNGGAASGTWLVWSVMERDGSPDVELELRMPEKSKKEPAAEVVQRADSSDSTPDVDADSKRGKIIEVALSSLTSRTGFSRYSQAGAANRGEMTPATGRTDCSQWVQAVYLQAINKDPGANTWEQFKKSKPTKHPKPGDLYIKEDQHVEMFVGPGKTIGHGSPPIDFAKPSDFGAGFSYRTFDFLS